METRVKIKTKQQFFLPLYSVNIENGDILKIRPTANAWWRQEVKVRLLLAYLKDGYKITDACKQASISLKKYKYFAKNHPELKAIRRFYKSTLIEKARAAVVHGIEANKNYALKFLRKSKPEEFPTPSLQLKVKQMEITHHEAQEGFFDEIQELKRIIGFQREVLGRMKLDSYYKSLNQRAESMIVNYNRTHWYSGQIFRQKF